MTDDIKNFTPDPGDGKRTSRGHLWSVATGSQQGEPVTVDVATDSMGGMDSAAMLIAQGEPGAVDASESEAINDDVEHGSEELSAVAATPAPDGRQGVEDLEAYELAYADGSTTPPTPAKRHLFRKRRTTVSADHELEAVVAASTTDVWAAHRDDSFETDAEPASSQPSGIPTASEGQDRSRRRRPLALVAVGAVVVALAGASIVAFGGGSGKVQAPRIGIAGGAKVHHKTHVPASRALIVTVPANVTSTTSAKLAARPKHTAKNKTDKRAVSDSTVTSTVTRTPVTSTLKVTSSSTSAPKTFTPPTTPRSSTSYSSSSTAGGLPDVQQTAQQP